MKKLKYKGKTFFKYPDSYYKNGKTTLHKFKHKNKYGTPLPCFHLHYKDDNKHNDDISNLELLTPQEHALAHKTMRRNFIFQKSTAPGYRVIFPIKNELLFEK